MITREGVNKLNQTEWKLHVPDEHCLPGLEVGIFATQEGLMIGGNVITWEELNLARELIGAKNGKYIDR